VLTSNCQKGINNGATALLRASFENEGSWRQMSCYCLGL